MSKRPPHNDWQTPLDQKKVDAFRKKIQDLADQEFGVDGEGDSALEVDIVDRTRGHMPPFRQVPYGHKDEAERKEAFEVAVFNLNVAHGTFETEDRVRCAHDAEERRAAKEKKP